MPYFPAFSFYTVEEVIAFAREATTNPHASKIHTTHCSVDLVYVLTLKLSDDALSADYDFGFIAGFSVNAITQAIKCVKDRIKCVRAEIENLDFMYTKKVSKREHYRKLQKVMRVNTRMLRLIEPHAIV